VDSGPMRRRYGRPSGERAAVGVTDAPFASSKAVAARDLTDTQRRALGVMAYRILAAAPVRFWG